MNVTLTRAFRKDAASLSETRRAALFETLLALPTLVKDPSRHGGVGLRKIHASGIFEARLGLGLRLVFGYRQDGMIFHRVGTHDEIRRYLRDM